MAGKLWDKGYDEDARIDAFTVGNDRELDLALAPYGDRQCLFHALPAGQKEYDSVPILPGNCSVSS